MDDPFYSDVEAEAASKTMPLVIKAIHDGDLDHAKKLLDGVLATFPENYRYRFQDRDGKWHIKFWDHEEFFYYVSLHGDESVFWMVNAYGKAFFYRGFICIEENNFFDALHWLDKGLEIEPDQPLFRMEKAKVFTMLKQSEAAMEEYAVILSRGEEVVPTARAATLRGIAFQLIELGDLDNAERSLKQSLELDPQSEVALGELNYIAHLREGGRAVKGSMTATVPDISMICLLCQKPINKDNSGSMMNQDGRLVYICDSCKAELRAETDKKWWQFWRR